jgi:hypothetical protein
MIKKLDQLKANFAKYEQGFHKLVTGECLCAEAVLAISNGAIIKSQFSRSPNMVYEDEYYYEFSIPIHHYAELNLSKYITKTELLWWKERLELTEKQIEIITSFCGIYAWSSLNDTVKLTFHQFSLLLDILDKL